MAFSAYEQLASPPTVVSEYVPQSLVPLSLVIIPMMDVNKNVVAGIVMGGDDLWLDTG